MNDVRKCEVIIAHFGLKIDASLIGSIFLFFRPSLVKKEFKPTKLPRFDGPLREGGLVWPRRASFLPPSLSPSLPFALPFFRPPFLLSCLPFALPLFRLLILSPSHPFFLPFPSLPHFPSLPFLPSFVLYPSLPRLLRNPSFLTFYFSSFLPSFLTVFFPFFWSQRDLALCDSSIADCLAVVKMSRRGIKV